MCGIAGILKIDGEPIALKTMSTMLQAISYRGPDDRGIAFFDLKDDNSHTGVKAYKKRDLSTAMSSDPPVNYRVAFGHNRLSILDLSEQGHQPMSTMDGTLWIVHNGEIYNYLELKETLLSKGYEFRSHTDTEVILNSYQEWGPDCLNRFNGMWAFAIWDRRKKILFCARDRFGIKPFYYYVNDRLLVFASEIKAILAAGVPAKLNMETLLSYLVIGITHQSNMTFFSDIMELHPGHWMSYDMCRQRLVSEPYYVLSPPDGNQPITISDLKTRLNQAIKFRLRSDVPVGTCLSGGIDSSTIASIAANMYTLDSDDKFSAITAKSEEKHKDESKYAQMVAAHSDLMWHTVEPVYDDFLNHIEDCLRIQEEPVGGPSVFMQYCVMKKANEVGLKVMLDGQGGDETMLGYERYYPAFFLYLFRNGHIWKLLREFRLAVSHSNLGFIDLLGYIIYFLNTTPRKIVLKNRFKFVKPAHLKASFKELDTLTGNSLKIDILQKAELTRYQLRHLLHYEDRNSMAHSIEARVPYIDHLFVEAALRLKPEDKINNGYTKYGLRKIAAQVLPREIAWRHDKIGFEAPTEKWLKNYRPKMQATVTQSDILQDICLTIPDFQEISSNVAWRLYNIALWEQQYHVVQ